MPRSKAAKARMTVSKAGRYPAHVFWSDEDAGFIATAPDLPGSSAFGETQSEALAQLEHAIEAWTEAATAAGNPIPQPSRPSVEAQPSGKLLVRMPKSLHANLVRTAKRENVSLNHYIVFLLTTATVYRTVGQTLTQYWETRGVLHVSTRGPGLPTIDPLGLTKREVVSTGSLVFQGRASW
jgi:predicted RNase H-like HicB family nuclease